MGMQLQLDHYHLSKFHIDWRAPVNPTDQLDELQTGLDYDVAVHSTEKNRYRLALRLRLSESGKDEEDVGYEVAADMVGFFSVPDDCQDEERERLVRVNGVSLLYSAFRGILSSTTGMFAGGCLTLPTILPHEVVKSVEKARRSQRRTRSSRPSAKPVRT